MSDNRRRYRAIKDAIKGLYPTEAQGNVARQLHTLAAMISGIVGGKSTNLPHIASKVPDRTKAESRVKKYYRWLTNERVGAELYFLPFAAALLMSLAHHPLVLAMDGSEVGRGCLTLMVSVIYHGRALPLAWIVIKGSKGHFPEEAHVELLKHVHAIVPEHAFVILLGDGEFDGTQLQATLDAFEWLYVCRTAKNIQLYADDEWFTFEDLGIERGERIGVPNVLFTHKAYGPVLVIAAWDKKYKDPIFLRAVQFSPCKAVSA
jgi:hypothetical protein